MYTGERESSFLDCSRPEFSPEAGADRTVAEGLMSHLLPRDAGVIGPLIIKVRW